MKRLVLCVIALSMLIGFSGCAAKYQYHSVILEKGNSDYKINIKMEKRFKTLNPKAFNIITVYINNREVLKGPLDESGEGSLEGIFNNKKLELRCTKESIFDLSSKCIIHLGDIRLGKYRIVQTVK